MQNLEITQSSKNFFKIIKGDTICRIFNIFVLQLIKVYKIWVSPFFPASCRFYPSCSSYAQESIKRFGFFKGAYLSLWRILKCNPFHRGGFDPVSIEEFSEETNF